MYRIGFPPFLECSSKGDKRFSAFHARMRLDHMSIEAAYQGEKVFVVEGVEITHLKPLEAKALQAQGHVAINQQAMRKHYSELWDQYFEANPELIAVILQYRGFTDIFGQVGNACQAEEVYRIWVATMARKLAKIQQQYSDLIVNVSDTALKKSDYVYCGRGSLWGNEYSFLPKSKALHKVASREESVAQHYFDLREQLRESGDLRIELSLLEGQKLGCYCHPKACHCAALAFFANTPAALEALSPEED